jgi:hypothetical protein
VCDLEDLKGRRTFFARRSKLPCGLREKIEFMNSQPRLLQANRSGGSR